MIKRSEYQSAQLRAATMIRQAGLAITEAEAQAIEVADFGLGRFEIEGAQVLTFFATERISTKILVLFPRQTLREHRNPPVGADPGKEEVIRVIAGAVHFYLPGEDGMREGWIPDGRDAWYTCRREVVLRPCDQLVVSPGTKHWFQAPASGAVMYSFSTCVRDGLDRFSDPAIVRLTQIIEDLPSAVSPGSVDRGS